MHTHEIKADGVGFPEPRPLVLLRTAARRGKKDEKVSDRIKELRGNLTQTQTTTKLGLTQQAWAKYESGANDPNPKTIKQLCLVFGTTSDWLLGLADEAAGAEPASVRVAELEAENARLRGEVQGLRFALEAVSKGVFACPGFRIPWARCLFHVMTIPHAG